MRLLILLSVLLGLVLTSGSALARDAGLDRPDAVFGTWHTTANNGLPADIHLFPCGQSLCGEALLKPAAGDAAPIQPMSGEVVLHGLSPVSSTRWVGGVAMDADSRPLDVELQISNDELLVFFCHRDLCVPRWWSRTER